MGLCEKHCGVHGFLVECDHVIWVWLQVLPLVATRHDIPLVGPIVATNVAALDKPPDVVGMLFPVRADQASQLHA